MPPSENDLQKNEEDMMKENSEVGNWMMKTAVSFRCFL
jgi:hypothetical protein